MRVAVVGSGVAGLAAARTLALAGVEVVLYERDNHVGGPARTVHVDGVGRDIGFMVFNRVSCPNMVTFFDEIGVEIEAADMSFSVSLAQGNGCEWASSSLAGLFAQKRNAINPFFWNMIRELVKFENDVSKYLTSLESDVSSTNSDATLGEFLQSRGYSQKFRECYLIPVCASICSCTSETVLSLSALSILTFCRNHHLLQVIGRPQWIAVKGCSENFVNKVVEELKMANAEIRIRTTVTGIKTLEDGKIQVADAKGLLDIFDKCVVAAHAPDALEMRGQNATPSEKVVLGSFQYVDSDIYVHRDKAFMPQNKAAWSAWNFLGDINGEVCLTYWLNLLQNLGDTGQPILVTLNPPKKPDHVEIVLKTSQPVPNLSAANGAQRLNSIQGYHGVWYCGSYQGCGSQQDGLESGLRAAKQVLDQKLEAPGWREQMVPTWSEFAARQAVIAVLKKFIRTGTLRLLESDESIVDFTGNEKGCSLTCTLRIQNPAFYWKIAVRADLGLADAFIDGDFSFVGDSKKNNLLHFLQLVIANRDVGRVLDKTKHYRGWWSPLFVSAALGSAASYAKHVLRDNSLTNARRNISQHYDLSNDMFSLFLDETMTYSCAIFKGPDDTLRSAQLRKIHLLIDKARIDHSHEVLEIGFGWGSMAVEVVRKTGCRYTGITLSKEQLAFAQDRVNEAGLQDRINFLLCDYRTLSDRHKYNRIISCEMLEAVGHEYYKEFFARCDFLLAKDGLVVLQTISIPDERYDEYRRSSDFIKEYIFPGGCLPCLSALTKAMTAGSTFGVEHLENIGLHYYQTLMCWRDNFLANSSEIRRLGFNEKFIRMWEYYFIYCAAGFQTCTLANLQLVLSRPGNVSALGYPYVSFPMGLGAQGEKTMKASFSDVSHSF